MRPEVGEQEKRGAGGGGGEAGEKERERGGNTLPYPTPSRFFLLPSLCAGEGLENAKVAVILR